MKDKMYGTIMDSLVHKITHRFPDGSVRNLAFYHLLSDRNAEVSLDFTASGKVVLFHEAYPDTEFIFDAKMIASLSIMLDLAFERLAKGEVQT